MQAELQTTNASFTYMVNKNRPQAAFLQPLSLERTCHRVLVGAQELPLYALLHA